MEATSTKLQVANTYQPPLDENERFVVALGHDDDGDSWQKMVISAMRRDFEAAMQLSLDVTSSQ